MLRITNNSIKHQSFIYTQINNQRVLFLTLQFNINHLNSSSLSRRTISTDILDPLSPPLSIIHCFRQVLRVTSRIRTEMLYLSSSWSPYLCSSMWRGPQKYIPYEIVPTSPAVYRMSGSSNLDSFRDSSLVAVQLLLCWVLAPWLVQYYSQHSCVVAVKPFLNSFC